ncbi:hypothetical protein FRX31_032881 [Thalictrum thalictroides]|uniref:Uncharacterized protein n=1 Tax=Thalictrum thalictroides TaxID=46969 RepID=A0A7J6UYN4_THATH|nr:hypothetical protein FRX31_032881 [Thalictrum thalictroides]
MKLNIISILFFAVQLAGIFAAAISNSTAECGSLGVMSTKDLPASINAANIRKCADHPLGHKRSGMRAIMLRLSVALTGIVGGFVVLPEVDNGAGLLPTVELGIGPNVPLMNNVEIKTPLALTVAEIVSKAQKPADAAAIIKTNNFSLVCVYVYIIKGSRYKVGSGLFPMFAGI